MYDSINLSLQNDTVCCACVLSTHFAPVLYKFTLHACMQENGKFVTYLHHQLCPWYGMGLLDSDIKSSQHGDVLFPVGKFHDRSACSSSILSCVCRFVELDDVPPAMLAFLFLPQAESTLLYFLHSFSSRSHSGGDVGRGITVPRE